MGVLSAVDPFLNETAMHVKALASNRLAWANRASKRPRVRAKERVKRTRENSKEKPKDPKVPKGSYKGKTSKTGLSGLENPKSETSSETQESAQTYPTDNSYTDNSCQGIFVGHHDRTGTVLYIAKNGVVRGKAKVGQDKH